MSWGLDGKYYKNDRQGINELTAANNRWRQQERQNRLLKEQNKVLKNRNKTITNNCSGIGEAGANEIVLRYGLDLNNSRDRKILSKKTSFIMWLSALPLLGTAIYFGFADMVIATIGCYFGYFPTSDFSDAVIGKPLLAIWIVYLVWLHFSCNALLKQKKMEEEGNV